MPDPGNDHDGPQWRILSLEGAPATLALVTALLPLVGTFSRMVAFLLTPGIPATLSWYRPLPELAFFGFLALLGPAYVVFVTFILARLVYWAWNRLREPARWTSFRMGFWAVPLLILSIGTVALLLLRTPAPDVPLLLLAGFLGTSLALNAIRFGEITFRQAVLPILLVMLVGGGLSGLVYEAPAPTEYLFETEDAPSGEYMRLGIADGFLHLLPCGGSTTITTVPTSRVVVARVTLRPALPSPKQPTLYSFLFERAPVSLGMIRSC
jgi:hypothetical protein